MASNTFGTFCIRFPCCKHGWDVLMTDGLVDVARTGGLGRYGVPAAAHLPRPNDFSNLAEYYYKRSMLKAMAMVRSKTNVVPEHIFRFLVDIFRFNTNTDNKFDDGYVTHASHASHMRRTGPPLVGLVDCGC
jgi:transcription initiation factor TFIID subunit 2